MTHSNKPLLAYYGDDFTGSTDVMECLTRAGVRTVLFLQAPNHSQIARFSSMYAMGVAGLSRSMSPAEMDQELPEVFSQLRALGAKVVHYKVCSTFDSSPQIGSVGHAIDLGQQVFASPFVPLVVGAPPLGRYSVFGNLFGRSGLDSDVFRLDRHPTMRQHPITPMNESDLRLHLAQQTAKKIGLFDILELAAPEGEIDTRFSSLLGSGAEIVLMDVLYNEQLASIGRLIWREAGRVAPLFAVGSSGIEYALAAHWAATGLTPEPVAAFRSKGPAEQVVVVSGSCAPVTDRQIAWALERGFREVPVQTTRLLDAEEAAAEIDAVVDKSLEIVHRRQSVIIHTSRGPQDPRIKDTMERLEASRSGELAIKLKAGKLVAGALGKILGSILQKAPIRRAAVTGGDSSGFVARALGIDALEMIAPIAPGGPLCRVYTPDKRLDGLEIVFKGGQVGKDDFFDRFLEGEF